MSISKSKVIYISLLLLAILITGAIFFLLSPLKKEISIKNNSEIYKVSYTPTDKFTTLLSNWKLWESDSVLIEQGGKTIYTTLKQITVIFTNQQQAFYSQRDQNKNIIWSSNAEIKNSTELIVYININNAIDNNPEYKNNKNRATDKLVTSIFLKTVYLKIFPAEVIKSDTNNAKLQNEVKNLTDDPNASPFKVTILKI